MKRSPRILLLTCPGPYPEHPPERDGIDQYGMRFTKHQDLFQVPIEYPFHLGQHFIARNLDAEVTVLDAPPPVQLALELARQPEIVGLSFPAVFIPRALQAARLIRRLAPKAKIVLGGHGVMCLTKGEVPAVRAALPPVAVVPGSVAQAQLEELEQIADEVCQGEGIAFLRQMIGQDPAQAVDGILPPSGIMRPFGLPLVPLRNMISLAPSMGCSGGCDFCCTGAFFGGRRRVILDPEQALRAIRRQLARVRPGDRAIGVLMDEDLLADADWFRSFGERLSRDPLVRERGFTYTAFGSVSALAQYSVEELLRYRLSNIWIGVETLLADTGVPYLDRKRRGSEALTFERLHRAGITTTASFILGWDFHDRVSTRSEVEGFLALRPTMAQVMPLIPAPGTRLWASMAEAGRLDPIERWEDLHYYGRGFRYLHFSVEELWSIEDDVERRLFAEQGPSFLKMVEVYLDGAERFRGHSDPCLHDMARVFCGFLQDLRPVLPAMIHGAPSAAVSREARRASERVEVLLGAPSLATRAKARLLRAYLDLQRRGLRLSRPYQPAPRRTVYSRGRAIRSAWGGP